MRDTSYGDAAPDGSRGSSPQSARLACYSFNFCFKLLTLNKFFLPSKTFRSANPAFSSQFNASYTVAGLIFTPLVRSERQSVSPSV